MTYLQALAAWLPPYPWNVPVVLGLIVLAIMVASFVVLLILSVVSFAYILLGDDTEWKDAYEEDRKKFEESKWAKREEELDG